MTMLTVVIPTLNRDAVLADTLRDVLTQQGIEFEVIVVDQNATPVAKRDARLAGLANEARVRWLHCVGRGVVYARNLAIAEARGEIIVFLDDDVRIEDGTFLEKHLLAHCESEPSVAAISGNTSEWDAPARTTQALTYERTQPLDDIFHFPRNYVERISAVSLSTNNCSIRRAALLAIGGFDENFAGASYGDDADLALRLESAGFWVLYDPRPTLVHLRAPMGGLRMSDRRNPFSYTDQYISAWLFYLKHVHSQPRYRRFYLYNHLLRKSILLRRNVTQPWRQPLVWWGLARALWIALQAHRRGHRSTLTRVHA